MVLLHLDIASEYVVSPQIARHLVLKIRLESGSDVAVHPTQCLFWLDGADHIMLGHYFFLIRVHAVSFLRAVE